MLWLELKNEMAQFIVAKDALHIYAAVAIQIVAAHVSRRSLGHWLPWLAVLALLILNEALDIRLGQEPTIQAWQIVGALHDAINTMLLPSILMLLCRRAPYLLQWDSHRRSSGLQAIADPDEAAPSSI